MTRKTIHVSPRGDQWEVKSSHALRAARVTATQAEAIRFGRTMAINQKAELIVHRPDGRIRSKDSFGSDPFPPRDREH